MPGEIAALGYIAFEVSDWARWREFASGMIGMQWCPREDGSVDVHTDQYATRIRLHEGSADDLAYAEWEVRDAAALERLLTNLVAAGFAAERGDPALCTDRRVAGLLRFADPEGTRHEAFYGPLQRINDPFVRPLGCAGRQDLGDLVLSCRDKGAIMAFFLDMLGFQLSDHIFTEVVPGHPLEISFLRCNGRQRSLALAPVPIRKEIVHLMVEVQSIDDVGRPMDRCQRAGVHLTFTLGRHSNADMLSLYPLTPPGFDLEFGWGGLEVDDESWHVLTHDANSVWGHFYQRPPRAAKVEAAS